MTQYVFREVVPLRGAKQLDAQKVGEIIAALPDKDDRPTALWQAAKRRGHYLHNCYEWDVQVAAEAHWRDVSRHIMNSIYAVDDNTKDTTPAFLSIVADSGRRYYEPTEINRSMTLQLALLRAAQRDLAAWQRRYRMLHDICPLVAAAEEKLEAAVAEKATADAA